MTTYTHHVTQAEWRWVSFMSAFLLFVSFSPFILIALFNPPNAQWQFMGALHHYQDAAANIARIQQGTEGQLLTYFAHTPEIHNPVLVHPLYAILGQIASFTNLSPISIFHIARLFAAFFMYLALYQLAASIWVKIRTRRIFFVVATLASGLGWLYVLITGFDRQIIIPDLMLPQLFPFYSASVNVHFPLAIAFLSLSVAIIIDLFRPGNQSLPAVDNGAPYLFLISLTIALIYPDALVPLISAYILCSLTIWFSEKQIRHRELRWGLWLIAPALPVLAYNLLTVYNNNFVANWLEQRAVNTPSLPMLLIGLGLPLIIAIPALWRAIRRFEMDGDRFMLLWLASMIVLMLLPLNLNHYFLAGLMLPIAYFATRATEDVWLKQIKRRYWNIAFTGITVLLVLSHLVWLYIPIVPILDNWNVVSPNVLNQGYQTALQSIDSYSSSNSVVLAAPDVGIWIPVWARTRPVYGHYAETYQSDSKRQQVEWYYQATSTDPICQSLIDEYTIEYVIVGQRERHLGENGCITNLELIETFADVNIYRTQYSRIPRVDS